MAFQRRAAENARQVRRVGDLRRRQDKLLEAYYAEALDVRQMKDEQQRLIREIGDAERLVDATAVALATVQASLDAVISLLREDADLYARGSDTVRRLLNQFFYERLLVDVGEVCGADERDVVRLLHTVATTTRGRSGKEAEKQEAAFQSAGWFRRELSGGDERTGSPRGVSHEPLPADVGSDPPSG